MDVAARGAALGRTARRSRRGGVEPAVTPSGGKRQFYFDITPMVEENWTGIPAVAAGLAGALLRAAPERSAFFFDQYLIPRRIIEDALARRSGLYLLRDFNQGRAGFERLDALRAGPHTSIGIWPTVKRQRRLFDVECSVIHDLSTLITPQFHTKENIAFHMEAIRDDLDSNDVTICVSEATKTDLEAYLGVPHARLAIAYNGIEWPAGYAARFAGEVGSAPVEPYLFVLGTREPRKNIACLLRVVESHPDLLEQVRIVITGQVGWLPETEVLTRAIRREVARGRVIFTGFLDDYEKYKLLRAATATVYPSYFEGFGLPVLESLSVGTPCVASFSSAIPEAGGTLCHYHDPFSSEDLHRAIRAMLDANQKGDQAFQADCRAWSRRFTWDAMLGSILVAIEPAIAAASGAA